MKKLLLCLALLMSSAFAQPGIIPGPSPQLWNSPDCGIGGYEAFALGNRRPSDGAIIDEHPGMLEIATPVVPALCVLTTTYLTTVAHDVQGIDMQMGSGLDVIMEWAMWLDIYTPDGKQHRLRMQYDKHTDARGNQVRYFPVNLTLPAGTFLAIRRPSVICVGIPSPNMYNPTFPDMFAPYDANKCITGQSVTFIDK